MNFFSSVRSFHIELSSKCALACPRCTRTVFPDKYEVTELPLSLIKERFHKGILKNLDKILFCGAHGDPIYHSEFVDVLKHFKTNPQLKITIVTNGSHRKKAWWEEVAKVLGPQDRVKFSIDGLEDTNPIYRKNANWQDIIGATQALREHVQMIWKFIVFRQNQHQIEAARDLAKELGFYSFSLVKSHTFGEAYEVDGVDSMRPADEYINPDFLQTASKETKKEKPNKPKIFPKCTFGDFHFIRANGQYMPCCWTANYPHFTEEYFCNSKHNLKEKSLEEIWNSSEWGSLENSWNDFYSAPKSCRQNCSKKMHQWQDSYNEKEKALRGL